LSLSRVRVAAELGLNRSVVGRWATGAVRPSADNLCRLSDLVARRAPGFTPLDWDLDTKSLAALFGIERGGAPATNGPGPGGGLPLPLLAQMLANTALRGGPYEGFYRGARPLASQLGRFAHDYCMIRKDESGLLRLNQAAGGVFVDGWVLPLKDHLFIIGVEAAHSTLMFAILHGFETTRADVLDGLVLALTGDPERTPTTTAIVFERIEDLSGDKAADDARFAQLAGGEWLAPKGSISEAVRRHLTRDTGGAELAIGEDWLMRPPLSPSLAP